MSSCVIPVLERFKRSNKSARTRTNRKSAANRETTGQAAAAMAPDTVRMRCSSVPPEPRSRRGIALSAAEEEEEEKELTGWARNVLPLPQRDSRGFTISKSGPGNELLRIRHDHPTLDLGDAAYQREHQAHRMNVRQYQELQRQLGGARPTSEAAVPPPRGVMSLGLPDNLRPGTLFRRIRDLDSGGSVNNSNSNLDSSNSSGDYKRSLPSRRRTKKPSTFEGFEIRPLPAASDSHFYSSLKKRSDSFSSGRGSDSTSCASSEAAIEAGMAVATFIPPCNGGRRPPSYLLPKALSPCPPTKMHPFIPNLDSALRQQVRQQQRADQETAEKRKDIADNASGGAGSLESSSSASSGSAGETDSLGGGHRNSSPDDPAASNPPSKFQSGLQSGLKKVEADKFGRLSPMVLSRPSHNRLKQQLLAGKLRKSATTGDLGYHTMVGNGSSSSNNSTMETVSAASSSTDLWDVRATKTAIRDLHILTHNAKHTPVSRRATSRATTSSPIVGGAVSYFDFMPDGVIVKVLSFLNSNQIILCSRVSRRFYFLAWEPELWREIALTGGSGGIDADLALRTIMRLLARNSSSSPAQTASNKLPCVESLSLGGCQRLTDRGLAIVARRCPQLRRLEVQYCGNITNGGIMDLVTKCTYLDQLDVSGCHMISTIGVHQPPPMPPPPSSSSSATMGHHAMRRLQSSSPAMMTLQPNSAGPFCRRQLGLTCLDLTDCVSVEDSGLKMIVETCPQLQYLFLRRCVNITDAGLKYVSSYCPSLRELSISDCPQITDFGLYELAKLGPNLRYLSVAKCDQISDTGVKQIAKLCYKLRYLNVRGCEAVSDEAIEILALSCSRLRSLDIGKCDVTDVGLKMLSEHCPNLKKLSVKSCEMVSDQGIQCVAYYCRGLQQLNIQDCPITLEGFRTVKKFCRRCIIEHSNPGFS